MRAVVITKHGPPEVLQVQERPDTAGPRRAGADRRRGGGRSTSPTRWPASACTRTRPSRPAWSATRWRAREPTPASASWRARCSTATPSGWRPTPDDILPLPDALSFEQGAAIPVNYATAWQGLLGYGPLAAGERVLIHAAAGGVGIAATQIAKARGAEVWGTASPGKHEAIRELRRRPPARLHAQRLGARPARSSTSSWTPSAGGPSAPPTSCCAPAGGSSPSAPRRSWRGRRATCSTPARAALSMPRFNLIKQMSESKAVIGLNMLTLWKDRGTLEPWIGPLRELLDDGRRPAGGGRGLPVRPRARRAPLHRRAAQRRQGRADAVARANCATKGRPERRSPVLTNKPDRPPRITNANSSGGRPGAIVRRRGAPA